MEGIGVVTRAAIGIIAGLTSTGCMSDALEVGRDPVQGNAGGAGGVSGGTGSEAGKAGSPQGGASGKAGRGGTGGDAGVPTAGTGGTTTGGTGGTSTGGTGGTSTDGTGGTSTGGTGGTSTGGTGGTSTDGAGGTASFQFDDVCDCTVDEGEFACTMSRAAFAARAEVPADCENDLDYVRRATCSGTLTRYRWLEGSENAYEVELNGTELRYASAIGYVGSICDISGDIDFGSVTAGTAFGGTCMEEECSVCERWLEQGANPPPRACEPHCTADSTGEYATLTLDDYCAHNYCPRDLNEARESVPAVCGMETPFTRRSGCGFEVIEKRAASEEAIRYYFDADDQRLVGVSDYRDTPWGDCEVFEYRGGLVPTQPCDEATTCTLCTYEETGEAGASGNELEPCAPP
jgi:hypothetical protein